MKALECFWHTWYKVNNVTLT